MADITIKEDRIHIGDRFSVSFNRTLRLPDDGKTYSLPPGLGRFPIRRIHDFAGTVPEEWRTHGGVFLPMFQREAMWITLSGASWKPSAVKVAVGKVNAVSGATWTETLEDGSQDYLVSPPQPWLDGINAGNDMVRQFVAMPLGMGYTVEGQVTGEERFGGIQLLVFDPKPGRFPDEPPALREDRDLMGAVAGGAVRFRKAAAPMGIAAGGKMRQKIYPDPYGVDCWDSESSTRLFVHIVNSEMWKDITGETIPNTPVDASAYTAAGLPWFDLYDEHLGDVASSPVLENVKTVKEKDQEHGFENQQNDSTVDVPKSQVRVIGKDKDNAVKDGDW